MFTVVDMEMWRTLNVINYKVLDMWKAMNIIITKF